VKRIPVTCLGQVYKIGEVAGLIVCQIRQQVVICMQGGEAFALKAGELVILRLEDPQLRLVFRVRERNPQEFSLELTADPPEIVKAMGLPNEPLADPTEEMMSQAAKLLGPKTLAAWTRRARLGPLSRRIINRRPPSRPED
jgi:hypothetical protein